MKRKTLSLLLKKRPLSTDMFWCTSFVGLSQQKMCTKGWMSDCAAGFENWLQDGPLNKSLKRFAGTPHRAHTELKTNKIIWWWSHGSEKQLIQTSMWLFFLWWHLLSGLCNKIKQYLNVGEWLMSWTTKSDSSMSFDVMPMMNHISSVQNSTASQFLEVLLIKFSHWMWHSISLPSHYHHCCSNHLPPQAVASLCHR